MWLSSDVIGIISQVILPLNLLYFPIKWIYKEKNLKNTALYALYWLLDDKSDTSKEDPGADSLKESDALC